MHDDPRPAALLEAMARTLTDEVVPSTDEAARHAARVVANLCRILAREFEQAPTAGDRGAMEALLDLRGGRADLATLLDERLRESEVAFDERALPVLLADVERRLAISRPSYLAEPS